MLTPPPQGRLLQGEPARRMWELLDAAEGEGRAAVGLLYANGCFAVGRYDDAARIYQSLLSERPHHITARFNLGLTFLRLRECELAVREFDALLALEPSLVDAYYQRGNAWDELGADGRALSDYAAAIRLAPDYLRAYYNQGVVLARSGRHRRGGPGLR